MGQQQSCCQVEGQVFESSLGQPQNRAQILESHIEGFKEQLAQKTENLSPNAERSPQITEQQPHPIQVQVKFLQEEENRLVEDIKQLLAIFDGIMNSIEQITAYIEEMEDADEAMNQNLVNLKKIHQFLLEQGEVLHNSDYLQTITTNIATRAQIASFRDSLTQFSQQFFQKTVKEQQIKLEHHLEKLRQSDDESRARYDLFLQTIDQLVRRIEEQGSNQAGSGHHSQVPGYIFRRYAHSMVHILEWQSMFGPFLDVPLLLFSVRYLSKYAVQVDSRELGEILRHLIQAYDNRIDVFQYIELQANPTFRGIFVSFSVLNVQQFTEALKKVQELHSSQKEIFSGLRTEHSATNNAIGRLYQGTTLVYEGEFSQQEGLNGKGRQQKHDIFYEGHFSKGLLSGVGTIIFPDGTRINGNFKDGLLSGQGEIEYFTRKIVSGVWQDGVLSEGKVLYNRVEYSGQLKNNSVPHGKGTMLIHQSNGTAYLRLEGEWIDDGQKKVRIYRYDKQNDRYYIQFEGAVTGHFYKGLLNSADGIYDGSSICLVKSGTGTTYFHPDNVKHNLIDKFENFQYWSEQYLRTLQKIWRCSGEWSQGCPKQAKFEALRVQVDRQSGKVSLVVDYSYDGTWKMNKYNGRGVLVQLNSRYEGEFLDGKKNGKGAETISVGDSQQQKYEGDWVLGQKTGDTVWQLGNGDTYVGQVVEGKFEGKGRYNYHESGKYYSGGWHNDHWHGEGNLYNKEGKVILEALFQDNKIYSRA